ncbi:MAG: DUF2752 domain-containing protein [Clostridia bacterium]
MDLRKVRKNLLPALVLAAAIAAGFFLDASLCVFKRATGLPCPSCGMTRAYIALFQGRFAEAFSMHPLFWLAPVILFLVVVSWRTKKPFTKTYVILTALLVLVYLLRMIFLFPGEAPMDYDFSSFLGKLLFP